MIPASSSVKKALDIYKTHRGIRTLAEAGWRACALGIRYDLLSDDPLENWTHYYPILVVKRYNQTNSRNIA